MTSTFSVVIEIFYAFDNLSGRFLSLDLGGVYHNGHIGKLSVNDPEHVPYCRADRGRNNTDPRGEGGQGFFLCFIEETFIEELFFQGEELQIEIALIDLHRHVAYDELVFSPLLVDIDFPFADNGVAVLDEWLVRKIYRDN